MKTRASVRSSWSLASRSIARARERSGTLCSSRKRAMRWSRRSDSSGDVSENEMENTSLEIFAQALGILPAAREDVVEPAPLPFGPGLESVGAHEQPPVPEGFVGVGVARGDEGFDQIHLVEVRGPCVG